MAGIWSWNESRQAPSLDGCRRKLARANHHIENIAADERSFLDSLSCGYGFRRDFHGYPPSLILTVEKINFPQVPDNLSIVAGEAIYQLRTTLDHLVFELIRAQSNEPTRDNAWPIHTKKRMSTFERKIKGVSKSAFELIESLQPYHRGDRYEEHILWNLRELNDWDKHNFVVRTFLAAPHGVQIEWTDSDGRPRMFSEARTGTIKLGDKFCIGSGVGIRPETNINVETKPYIVFEHIAGLQSKPISTTLNQLATEVAEIVERFCDEF